LYQPGLFTLRLKKQTRTNDSGNMKIGDLVEFHTSASVFSHANSRYVNPGIIIDIHRDILNSTPTRAEVFWSDGKITTEFDSYLHLVDLVSS
jgi:hypothetical protein